MDEQMMTPEEWQAKLRADVVALFDEYGMVPLSAVERVVREWVAANNESMAQDFKWWNEALARGEQHSMSITHDAGGVWEWMRTRIAEMKVK